MKLNKPIILNFMLGLLTAAVVVCCQPSHHKGDDTGISRPKTPESHSPTSKIHVVHRSISAMGTLFEITAALKQEDDVFEKAIRAAFDEIRRVEQLMTTWKMDTPLARVNARAGSTSAQVPKELLDLVEEAKTISALTNGKFDISFASMGGLWDFKNPHPKLPDPREVKKRLPLIDYQAILIDHKKSTIKLDKIGMKISLGAIAKGYGVDRVSHILKEHGFNDFIIFGGGDLFISGKKGDRPWRVGIQDPRNRSRYFARIALEKDSAVVTSGDYEKFFTIKGKRYHHIIDPATGFPAKNTMSVTVIAGTVARADAFATGIFVLGPEKGMALIEATSDLEGVIVDSKLKVLVSSGIKSLLELTPIENRQGEMQ